MGNSDQAALLVSEGRYEHLDINKLNSMTMSNFQQSFVQEIEDAVTQPELLTVRDLSKIKSMLKYIYRHVMRLNDSTQIEDEDQQWTNKLTTCEQGK